MGEKCTVGKKKREDFVTSNADGLLMLLTHSW